MGEGASGVSNKPSLAAKAFRTPPLESHHQCKRTCTAPRGYWCSPLRYTHIGPSR